MDKLSNPVWTGTDAGAGLTGFITGALGKTGGTNPDVNSIYAGTASTNPLLFVSATWLVLAWRVPAASDFRPSA